MPHRYRWSLSIVFFLLLWNAGWARAMVEAGYRVDFFAEPLVAAGPGATALPLVLQTALEVERKAEEASRFHAIDRYLEHHPDSPWAHSLLLNTALAQIHAGYFSSAIARLERAYRMREQLPEDVRVKAQADRVLGELLRLHARIGHAARLRELLQNPATRNLSGAASEWLTLAQEALWELENHPRETRRCGIAALSRLLAFTQPDATAQERLEHTLAQDNGMSLAQSVGLETRMIRRQPGQPLPLPSVVHWKVGHFAALLEYRDGRYRVQDPAFEQDYRIKDTHLNRHLNRA